MKRKLVSGIVVLTGFVLISGCSFNFKIPDNISKLNPFKKKVETAVKTGQEDKEVPVKSKEETIKEVDGMVDRMVEKLKAGEWGTAINIGEQAYMITVKEPVFKSDVREEVYITASIKEKLFETLVEAYDYKNHVEGLSKEEKNSYIRAAREHFNINPSNIFKKHALAKVLIETGNYSEGLPMAAEVYNAPEKNNDITDTFAWGHYLAGNRTEAYNIYNTFYAQAETLIQLYHSAVAVEEQNKALGLNLYRVCEKAGNNLMVREENLNNLSAQSYINRIIGDSQKAINRLLAGGSGVDSQYKMDTIQSLVHSVVKL